MKKFERITEAVWTVGSIVDHLESAIDQIALAFKANEAVGMEIRTFKVDTFADGNHLAAISTVDGIELIYGPLFLFFLHLFHYFRIGIYG